MNNSSQITKVPFLGLCMIVKNESHIIGELLNCIYPFIDTYVISDTGSTDNTKEIIKSFFDSKNIPGYIYDDKWEDFGTNRTIAFRHCIGKMTYAWVMDADDLIEIPKNSNIKTKFDLQQLLRRDYADYYTFDVISGVTYQRPHIFKVPHKWRYVGVLHEYSDSDIPNKTSSKINGINIISRRLGARNKVSIKEKYLKDVNTLLKGLEKEPNNTRYMFYLAQSYRDAGDFEKSNEWYLKRSKAGGWEEEAWYALYQVGANYNKMGKIEEAKKTLLKAFEMRPKRSEPLHLLSLIYNNQKEYKLATEYANKGRLIPKPNDDILFIEDDVYKYRFNYILAMSGIAPESAQKVLNSDAPENVKEDVRGRIKLYPRSN